MICYGKAQPGHENLGKHIMTKNVLCLVHLPQFAETWLMQSTCYRLQEFLMSYLRLVICRLNKCTVSVYHVYMQVFEFHLLMLGKEFGKMIYHERNNWTEVNLRFHLKYPECNVFDRLDFNLTKSANNCHNHRHHKTNRSSFIRITYIIHC